MSDRSPPSAETEPFRLSTAARWYMVGILSLANAVSYLDRQALPLLVPQIEQDLGLSDTQMSIVVGAAFVVAWTVVGFFAGVLTDRVDRKLLLASGACVWGLMTLSCGWATSFATLCLGRMGVGVGEAVVGPCTVSLIKNGVPPSSRGRAIGIWALGASLGAAFALLGGGAILGLIKDVHGVDLPWVGAIRAWQLVLAASGLLALPLALLALTIRDPGRAPRAAGYVPDASFADAWRFVWSNKAVFLPLFAANGATVIMIVAYQIWQPTLFGRAWHVPRPIIGLGLGLIVLCLSSPSQFLAGLCMDWLDRRGIARGAAVVGLWLGLLSLLPAILSPVAPTLAVAWVLAAVYAFLTTGFFTVGLAAITKLTPAHLAGRVAALHFSWVGILGTALGTTLIAVVSDFGFAGPQALGRAMASVCGALDLLAIFCFARLLVTWPHDAAASTSSNASNDLSRSLDARR